MAGDPDVTTVCLAGKTACLQGYTNGTRRVFRGVRYATAARWTPPRVESASWGSARLATSFGAGCPQLGPGWASLRAAGNATLPAISEDCLFLNVYTPAATEVGPFSTLVFIHGGSFQYGGSWDSEIASAPQFTRDVAGVSAAQATLTDRTIYVTLNYRLGALGYLGGDALRVLDVDRGATGNYGHLDQRAALRWVKSHIAAFGGDPQRIALFGESAGAAGVAAHLTMAASFGLVRGAAMQSGAFANWGSKPKREAQAVFDAYAVALGCAPAAAADVRACLVRQPLAKLLDFADPFYGDVSAAKYSRTTSDRSGPAASGLAPATTAWALPFGNTAARCLWAPVVDGVELTAPPAAALAAGHIDPGVSYVLLGFNVDEGSLSAPRSLSRAVASTASTREAAEESLRRWLGEGDHGIELSSAEADAVAAAYRVGAANPVDTEKPALSAWAASSRVLTDFAYACASLRAARALAAQRRVVYVYRWAVAPTRSLNVDASAQARPFGAFHGSEVPFVWGAASELATGAERGALFTKYSFVCSLFFCLLIYSFVCSSIQVLRSRSPPRSLHSPAAPIPATG